jgi:hypothetical protein
MVSMIAANRKTRAINDSGHFQPEERPEEVGAKHHWDGWWKRPRSITRCVSI